MQQDKSRHWRADRPSRSLGLPFFLILVSILLPSEEASGFTPVNAPIDPDFLGNSHQQITRDAIEELVSDLYGIDEPPFSMRLATFQIELANAATDFSLANQSTAHFDGEAFQGGQTHVKVQRSAVIAMLPF